MLDRDVVRSAHGDAWQALGRLFEGRGGGTAECRGARLMASGLPHPQWNSGDVLSSEVDLEAARAFYSGHGVPWGLRVPSEIPWSHGTFVLRLRLMGLLRPAFRRAPAEPGLRLEVASSEYLQAVLHVDSIAFGSDGETTRAWLKELLAAPSQIVTVVRATADGQSVGTGYSVLADGVAGRTGYIAGIAVMPEFRRRGYGSALSSWLVERAFVAGATLVHLHPDDDRAASLYSKLGFAETAGLNIYVDL